MKTSIHDTNALNKPTKGYKQPVKEKRGKSERTSVPNYRTLSQTPAQLQKKTLSGQVQFGQPPTDPKRTAPKTIPPRVSNRIALPSETKTLAIPKAIPAEPLHLPDTTKKPIGKQYATASKPIPKQFRNRFDNPLTERELNQLKLTQLKGKGQRETKELLEKLLKGSQHLAQQLTRLKPQQQELTVPIKTEMAPVLEKGKGEQTKLEILTNELLELQRDIQFVDQEYSKLSTNEQKVAIQRLRQKYKAGKKANTNHIKKLIQDEISKVQKEIQLL